MSSSEGKREFAPGTYNFKKVYLRDHDIDIRFITLEINLYESIFQPCMTGDILITDANNLLANLPITEGNIIEIHLVPNENDTIQQNVDDPDGIHCTMEVIKITSRVKLSKQDVQTYNLHLASYGWSNNTRTRLSRSYVDMKYSEMVDDIFHDKFQHPSINGITGGFDEEELKGIDIEPTFNKYSVIIPRWKPIQTFNWLAGRSQSDNNPSAVNYFFWEDMDKFNFKSIDTLIKEGKAKLDPKETYYVKLQNIDKNDYRNYWNISEYTYEDTGDVLVYALDGVFGSRGVFHEPVTKQFYDFFDQGEASLIYNVIESINYNDEFEKIEHIDDGNIEPLIPQEASETLSIEPGNTRLFVQPIPILEWDSTLSDDSPYWLRQRSMQKPIWKYLKLRIITVGLFKRRCGDVIKIDLPSPEEQKGKLDPRLKGNYLITTLRRIFKPTKHECIMEVAKDDFIIDPNKE